MSLGQGQVALDLQGAQVHWERGIQRYSLAHLEALLTLAPDLLAFVRVNPGLRVPERLYELDVPILEWQPRDPPPERRPSVYHLTSTFDRQPLRQVWPPWARGGETRTVATLYDLIPYLFADQYLAGPGAKVSYVGRLALLHRFDHLLAISEVTAADAIREAGISAERVTVISGGVDPTLTALVPDQAAAKALIKRELPGVREGFLLYVGGGDPRKNLERLVRGYGQVAPELRLRAQLVIACGLEPSMAEQLRGLAAELGVGGDILLTGHVSDQQLIALYRACGLFVFPSIYEGFGLPIAEAGACGAPVLASDTRSSREILGPCVPAAFDPQSVPAIAAAITAALEQPDLVQEMRARSARGAEFTWNRVAERTVEAYEKALAQPRAHRFAALPALPRAARGGRRGAAPTVIEAVAKAADGEGAGAGGASPPARERLAPVMLNQLARYAVALRLVEAMRPASSSLLEVGSGSEGIARFASSRWDITVSDRDFSDYGTVDLAGQGVESVERVEADVTELPFSDREFDVVLTLDLLEHVPPELRERALSELARVTGGRLIAACPCSAASLRADRRLARFYRLQRRQPPTWLQEHLENGFPEADELAQVLRRFGSVETFPNENLAMHFVVSALEGVRGVARGTVIFAGRLEQGIYAEAAGQPTVASRLLRALRGGDRPPAYRQFVVLDRAPADD